MISALKVAFRSVICHYQPKKKNNNGVYVTDFEDLFVILHSLNQEQ